VAASVPRPTLNSHFSTLAQKRPIRFSFTFIGMMIGSFLTGFLGRFGFRPGARFHLSGHLIIFVLASIASAFLPNMSSSCLLRWHNGHRLGAELVAGYAAMTEFLPPQARGPLVRHPQRRRRHQPAHQRASQRRAHSALRLANHVRHRGVGALIVWYLRNPMLNRRAGWSP